MTICKTGSGNFPSDMGSSIRRSVPASRDGMGQEMEPGFRRWIMHDLWLIHVAETNTIL